MEVLEAEEYSMVVSDNKENEMDSGDTNVMPLKDLEKTLEQHRNLYTFKPFIFSEINKDANSKKPAPRSGHRTVCDESNLYSLGGYLEIQGQEVLGFIPGLIEKVVFEELYKYNLCRKQWERMETSGKFPVGLVSHTASLHGNRLVVFGGTNIPFGEISSSDVDICNLSTNTWTQLSTHGQGPVGLYGHSSILDEVNKCLYVVGGTTGFEFFIDIYRLDLVSGKWEELFISRGNVLATGEPSARYRHETAFDGTLIYILGGGKQASCDSFDSIPVFNIHKRTWSKMDSIPDEQTNQFPASRKSHGVIQIEENVWMSGGENGQDLFDEFWNLHLPTMKWSLMFTKIPLQLSFHSVSISPQGCMYIFGGVHKITEGIHRLIFKERTNTLFKTWLKIPSLKEICWEALNHYDDSIKNLPLNDLIVKGIPRTLAERIHD